MRYRMRIKYNTTLIIYEEEKMLGSKKKNATHEKKINITHKAYIICSKTHTNAFTWIKSHSMLPVIVPFYFFFSFRFVYWGNMPHFDN